MEDENKSSPANSTVRNCATIDSLATNEKFMDEKPRKMSGDGESISRRTHRHNPFTTLSNGNNIRKFDDIRFLRRSFNHDDETRIMNGISINRWSNHLLSIRNRFNAILIFYSGACPRWKFPYFSNYRITCVQFNLTHRSKSNLNRKKKLVAVT